MHSELIKFYKNETNVSGFTYSEVMGWSDLSWDECHEFIQWIFPTNQPSAYNHYAPILTKEDAKILVGEHLSDFKTAVSTFIKILTIHEYLSYENHNWLRITRVLTTMRLLGLNRMYYNYLGNFLAASKQVSEETIKYWLNTINVEPLINVEFSDVAV